MKGMANFMLTGYFLGMLHFTYKQLNETNIAILFGCIIILFVIGLYSEFSEIEHNSIKDD